MLSIDILRAIRTFEERTFDAILIFSKIGLSRFSLKGCNLVYKSHREWTKISQKLSYKTILRSLGLFQTKLQLFKENPDEIIIIATFKSEMAPKNKIGTLFSDNRLEFDVLFSHKTIVSSDIRH